MTRSSQRDAVWAVYDGLAATSLQSGPGLTLFSIAHNTARKSPPVSPVYNLLSVPQYRYEKLGANGRISGL